MYINVQVWGMICILQTFYSKNSKNSKKCVKSGKFKMISIFMVNLWTLSPLFTIQRRHNTFQNTKAYYPVVKMALLQYTMQYVIKKKICYTFFHFTTPKEDIRKRYIEI